MYCLKYKHLWELFSLAGTIYRKCQHCFVTQIVRSERTKQEKPNDPRRIS